MCLQPVQAHLGPDWAYMHRLHLLAVSPSQSTQFTVRCHGVAVNKG
jgi:hypothetical protein